MKKLYMVELNSQGAPNFATAVEQPERKKGRWVYLSSVHGIDTSTRTYSYPFCSECGREHPVANFCSNCGADMREDEE